MDDYGCVSLMGSCMEVSAEEKLRRRKCGSATARVRSYEYQLFLSGAFLKIFVKLQIVVTLSDALTSQLYTNSGVSPFNA